MQDFAHQMRWLVDEAYPDAPVVRVVLDNLNTRRMASLYETFPAARSPAHREAAGVSPHTPARQLAESCPELAEGMAEIEFSVLTRACLQGRNPDETTLQLAINAYEAERNAAGATINWRFNTQDARAKLHRLYPFNSKID